MLKRLRRRFSDSLFSHVSPPLNRIPNRVLESRLNLLLWTPLMPETSDKHKEMSIPEQSVSCWLSLHCICCLSNFRPLRHNLLKRKSTPQYLSLQMNLRHIFMFQCSQMLNMCPRQLDTTKVQFIYEGKEDFAHLRRWYSESCKWEYRRRAGMILNELMWRIVDSLYCYLRYTKCKESSTVLM